MEKEIIDGNKIIAEFMKIPECDRCFECGSFKFGVGLYYTPAQMDYYSKWDWLMPVVEKIAKGYDVRITWMPTAIDVTYIDRPDVNNDGEITSMGGMTAIENTWYTVVRFIEWYNKNSKTKRL